MVLIVRVLLDAKFIAARLLALVPITGEYIVILPPLIASVPVLFVDVVI